ncbi:MAG: undecaprenyl/decaprenyl-phosphate alpha-N-acetylglucosaminyl 1-phosphate transferase [Fimbriiglobus sp.]|jgi:UDP-GlcNAc:undecaprenyl-phosphate GlcNAc-1-phosphate transferase|nr:undecaprenyl/decaprenyl-phosphate alpha-N-acetylglucosaminyl 1-phosphate transferase [Fimbriiglobus sp.]
MATACLLAFSLALVFGLIITRVAIPIAARVGLTDRPDGRRKLQSAPVPVVGGVALFVGVLAALGVSLSLSETVREVLLPGAYGGGWLLVSAALMVGLGVIDDRWPLRARFKLVGQIGAVLPALLGGFQLSAISLFGLDVQFGVFGVPLTVLWFLAAVNAINLLDGMDGMLGTLGGIVCIALAVMGGMVGSGFTAVTAAALVGGLAAFLWYNRPPARVYLGDAGSTLIGLVVAALCVRGSVKGAGTAVAILAPCGLLVLPFFDTAAAVLRRTLTGRGLAAADRGHLHHLLQQRLSRPWALLTVGVLGCVAATGAILATYFENDAVAVVAACGVIALLLARGLFGLAEVKLLASRLRAVVRAGVLRPEATEVVGNFQGTVDWEAVWVRVAETAKRERFTAVQLDVTAPRWQLDYHRRWEARGHTSDSPTGWRVEVPLTGHGQTLGRLTIWGKRGEGAATDYVRGATELAVEVEVLIAALIPTSPASVPAANTNTMIAA